MKCTHCKSEIPQDYKFCPDCGHLVKSKKQNRKQASGLICPSCKTKILIEEVNFCPYCGHNLRSTNSTLHPLTFTVNGITVKMIPVEHGFLKVGKNRNDSADSIIIGKDFFIGETTVTQAL